MTDHAWCLPGSEAMKGFEGRVDLGHQHIKFMLQLSGSYSLILGYLEGRALCRRLITGSKVLISLLWKVPAQKIAASEAQYIIGWRTLLNLRSWMPWRQCYTFQSSVWDKSLLCSALKTAPAFQSSVRELKSPLHFSQRQFVSATRVL